MAEGGLFAIVWLLARVTIAVIVFYLRVLSWLFLVPLWSKPKVRYYAEASNRSRPGSFDRRYDHANGGWTSFWRELGEVVGELRSPTRNRLIAEADQVDEAEAARAERDYDDTIRALVKLGYPKTRAERLSGLASDELGSGATFDALVKRALQLAGRA